MADRLLCDKHQLLVTAGGPNGWVHDDGQVCDSYSAQRVPEDAATSERLWYRMHKMPRHERLNNS
jgi:hypothetical protein